MFHSCVKTKRKNFKLVTNEALKYCYHATGNLETSSICKLHVNNLFLTRSLEGFLLNVPKQNLQANPENPVL